MPVQRTSELIEVAWSGPHEPAEVEALNGVLDFGLIAIYGSHPVFGPDALLYVDEAREHPFGARMRRVEPWTRHLPSAPSVYLGRLGGPDSPTLDEWRDAIDRAYRLVTFFHAPPWNSRGLDHHGVLGRPTTVLNVGRRHRLAMEVSTAWDESAWDPKGTLWRPYGRAEGPEPAEGREPEQR